MTPIASSAVIEHNVSCSEISTALHGFCLCFFSKRHFVACTKCTRDVIVPVGKMGFLEIKVVTNESEIEYFCVTKVTGSGL